MQNKKIKNDKGNLEFTAPVVLRESPLTYSKLKTVFSIFIAVLAFALYLPTSQYGYVYDDFACIKDNKLTKEGISALPKIMTTDYWAGVTFDGVRCRQYRPLPMALFAIEWELFPNNSKMAHAVNIILYSILCVLLFYLLTKIFSRSSIAVPFIAALIFTTHPVHTEVICNIKSVDEILCFLFSTLTLLCALNYSKNKSTLSLTGVIFCYSLALLSKETAVAFVLITPLFIYFLTDADKKSYLTIMVSLSTLTIIYLLVREYSIREVPNLPMDKLSNGLTGTDYLTQKTTTVYILSLYLLLLIFPHPLSYDYSFKQINYQPIDSIAFLLSALVIISILLYGLRKMKSKSIASFAILFFFLSIAPVSNFFMLIGSMMAERFLFIPSFGFAILIALLLTYLFKPKKTAETCKETFKTHTPAFLIAFVICSAYSVKLLSRSPDWKNNGTLFLSGIKTAPKSGRTHLNYGNQLLSRYDESKEDTTVRKKYLTNAIQELSKAQEIIPNLFAAWRSMGFCYYKLNDRENAYKYFMMALPYCNRNEPEMFNYIGSILNTKNEFEKALPFLDSSAAWEPKAPETHNNLGYANEMLGNLDKGIAEYKKAIELDTNFIIAMTNLALAYMNNGKSELSIPLCERSIKINPKYADAYSTMGGAYCNLGKYDEAISILEKGIKVAPQDTTINKFMGITYQNKGDLLNARKYYAKAGVKM